MKSFKDILAQFLVLKNMDRQTLKGILEQLVKDYNQQEILSTFANFNKRKDWTIGSKCSVFSCSKQIWINGIIKNVFMEDIEEWLTVKYGNKTKQIQRYHQDIQPIPYTPYNYNVLKYITSKSKSNSIMVERVKFNRIYKKIQSMPLEVATSYLVHGYIRLYSRYIVTDIVMICQNFFGCYHANLFTFYQQPEVITLHDIKKICEIWAEQYIFEEYPFMAYGKMHYSGTRIDYLDHQHPICLSNKVSIMPIEDNKWNKWSNKLDLVLRFGNELGNTLIMNIWNLFVWNRLYLPELVDIEQQQIWKLIQFLWMIKSGKLHYPHLLLDFRICLLVALDGIMIGF